MKKRLNKFRGEDKRNTLQSGLNSIGINGVTDDDDIIDGLAIDDDEDDEE